MHRLGEIKSATFFSLFPEARTKMEIAVTFIALLELIHESIVTIRQNGCYEDIFISKAGEEAS